MNKEEILDAIRGLARSMGFYGRLYEQFMEIKEQDEEAFDNMMKALEDEHLKIFLI